jgi:hypothetical protein
MTCVAMDGNTYDEHDVPNPDAPEGDADRLCDRCALEPEQAEEYEAARYDIYGEEIATGEENAIEDSEDEYEDWDV